jgi:hypothetical protein
MGVSVPTAITTTGDLDASRNALNTLFIYQMSDGMLPYAGPPVSFFGGSDTYHLWALLGVYNVAVHDSLRADTWLRSVWDGFQRAVAASTAKVSASSGLFVVDRAADWARGGQGGENCPANMLYYRVLTAGAELAARLDNHTLAAQWTLQAAHLKAAILGLLWDDGKGAFWDNTNNHQLYPQDGNSLAVWFNLTNESQGKRISDYLHSNWGAFGARTPEWGLNIGTFPGSLEVHAHMAAGEAARAHDLIRLQWGYMLNKPESTQSTFWEGYNADGTFNYDGIYMSNAHGWATGPAAALTAGTLGLRLNADAESTYVIEPLFGELAHCRGRFANVSVAWSVNASAAMVLVDSSARSDRGLGRILLNLGRLHWQGSAPRAQVVAVAINRVTAWQHGKTLCATGLACGMGNSFGSVEVRAGEIVEVSNLYPQSDFSVLVLMEPLHASAIFLTR